MTGVPLEEQVKSGLLPMVCVRDGLNHMIKDADFIRGRELGACVALCGHIVGISALGSAGKRCESCRSLAELHAAPSGAASGPGTAGVALAGSRGPLSRWCASLIRPQPQPPLQKQQRMSGRHALGTVPPSRRVAERCEL